MEWLQQRLTDERAEDDWRRLLPELYREGLSRPLRAWIHEDALLGMVEAHREEAVALAWARALMVVLEELRVDLEATAETPEALFGPEAVHAAQALAARPGLPPEAWIRHLFAQPAADMLIADTLYRSVRDFSTAIPRLVQTMLPGFLGRFARVGGSAVGAVAEEVEKRLEPEIKRFVDRGSQKALERAADFAVKQIDSDQAVAARRSFVEFLARQPVVETARILPPREESEALLGAVARRWVHTETLRDGTERAVRRWFALHGDRPVQVLLEAHGLGGLEPPFEAWAELSWPIIRGLLKLPAAQAWIAELDSDKPES
ncbi:MAG: hypothetical protein AAGD10_11660 [Myxococcota bacterium]